MCFVIKTIFEGGVHRNKLWLCLALGALTFAYSCKQANSGGGIEPIPSNEITITVKGDDGVIVNKLNTIKVNKSLNLTWKDIKRTAESIITFPNDKEIKEWRIKDAKGRVLLDADKFEKDEIVWAVLKDKVKTKITITVRGDEGVKLSTPDNFTVDVASKWSSIKFQAEAIANAKENFEIIEWRLNGKTGELLNDGKEFNANAIVFAVSKQKEKPPVDYITITIEVDEGYIFKEVPCKIEAKKKDAWGSIKEKAEAKIEIKDDYEKTGWKLGGKDGGYLGDGTTFNENCIVYATSKKKGEPEKPKIIITVRGDEGIEVGMPNNFTVDEGSKWGGIKTQAEAIANVKENFEIIEWRLNGKTGEILNDGKEFNTNAIVFVVSRQKEKPPVNSITITIEADEGYIFKEVPCKIEAKKKDAWSSIKEKAEAKITLKEDYEKTGWKLGGKDGGFLEDSHTFNENAVVYATSKKKGEPEKPKIIITINGDEGVEIATTNTLAIDKGSKWGGIKSQAEAKATAKENFEIIAWHLNDKNGELLNGEKEFNENTIVFAVSKRKVAGYKVEHLQENIENEEFTVKESEEKTGEAGKNTNAVAKQYEGFSCQGLVQSVIKADGTTVVQIKYRRNRVSLILDLDEGITTTELKKGKGDKKLLEGKFGASVSIEMPTKENHSFEKWEPALPSTFPATSPTTVYTAKWTKDSITITVQGDENIDVASENTVSVGKGSKWAKIKEKVAGKATAKENFEIIEWRLNGKMGGLLDDEKEFKENTTVFAVSKPKNNPNPPIPPETSITITIEADEGYILKETPCKIEVKKKDSWASIKEKAEAKITLKEDYEKTGWKLGGKDGGFLEDSHTFNENAVVYATSKKKGEPEKPKIIITINGDEGVEIATTNTLAIDKGSKWGGIKSQAEAKATAKENFEIIAWHLNDKNGELLNGEKEFNENTIVFAVSKRKVAGYKVEHLQENIENEEFTVKESEEKTGEAGKNTNAVAKQYEGFSCQGLVQSVIKADGTTVVQIKYRRNRVSLILDLDEGITTTELKKGKGDKKLLEGKFGASVSIEMPTKENHSFEKWEPALPSTFPATSPTTVYTAKWTKDSITITVQGDENIDVASENTVSVGKGLKWAKIKEKVAGKATAKENFEIKEWRLNGKTGRLLDDEKEFKADASVFAVSKRKRARYKVEHLQENIENEEFTLKEGEEKTGEVGKNTDVVAKQYEGFKAQVFSQTLIKADGTTLVQIKYKRNRVSLILDLDEGITTTELKKGKGDKKLLEGKFGASVSIEMPTKENHSFEKWEPVLPSTFPATSPTTVYTAKWTKDSIRLTVIGDENIDVASENTVNVDKGSKWASIKAQAETIATPKENFEITEWHLNGKNGELINDEKEFKETTTIFAISKRKIVKYKVQYLQENIEDDEYTSSEEETKRGEAGKNTDAVAKQYEGFSCQGLAQSVIKADGSTVVQIKYKRNRVSLILDLAGGRTIPELESAEGGKKLLKGKFEGRVEVKGLEKENYGFEKWEPALPSTFPATNSTNVYTAKWTSDRITITVLGDENINVASENKVSVGKGAKWADIKVQVEAKTTPKGNFEIKEWRLNDKNGTRINESYEFNENTTVFAKSKKQEITITVQGDEGIEVYDPSTFIVEKNSKWENIKAEATEKMKVKKYYSFVQWCKNTADGEKLEDSKIFKEDTVVFAVSKRKRARYKVEHYLQNLENEEYTKLEKDTEEKENEAGRYTEALAKQYPGFTALDFAQKEIKENGSTVVRIKYQRNVVSLIIDLQGGETKTELQDGNGGKKLLKGKFEEEVYIKEPIKSDAQFDGWEPELPTHFPANDTTVYTAKWGAKTVCKVMVEGDERVKVASPEYINVSIASNKTFGQIKSELMGIVSFADGWSSEDYCIYDWRMNDETGEKIEDSTLITKDIVVYVRTNYKRFRLYGTRLSGCEGGRPRGRIFLPKEIESINENSFNACDGLTTADLSGCVKLKTIGDDSFRGCSKLKDIHISDCSELTEIGERAFNGCASLGSIDLSPCAKLTKIGNSAFDGCASLGSVNLSGCGEITEVGWSAFYNCKSLETIDLSPCIKLTKIGDSAFNGCGKLKSVDVSDCTEITEIGFSAFRDCASLETIDLSPCVKLTKIGNYVFNACAKLKSVNLSGCAEFIGIEKGIYSIEAFEGCASLETVNLSGCAKLAKLEENLFKDCGKLKSVNLSGCIGLTEIGERAFNGCASLGSIDLSPCAKLTKIGNSAFDGCASLGSVNLSGCGEITEVGWSAFYNCKSLETIDLSPCIKLTKIGDSAFNGCGKLKSVDVSDCTEITEIGFSAFRDCASLETIDLSPCVKLTKIGNYVFNACAKLKSVNLSGCAEFIGIEKGIYSIEAFEGCASLETVNLSGCAKLAKLEEELFKDCGKLKSVNLSGCIGLTEIGARAFLGCASLGSIDLSPCVKLTKIGNSAFDGCKNARVKLPKSITEIANGAFGSSYGHYCQRVLVPSVAIKQLVIQSGYDWNLIEMYQP